MTHHRLKLVQPSRDEHPNPTPTAQAPHTTRERLTRRVLFWDAQGEIQQHSVYSTQAPSADPHTSTEADQRLREISDAYELMGYRVIQVEFVSEVSLELGHPRDDELT